MSSNNITVVSKFFGGILFVLFLFTLQSYNFKLINSNDIPTLLNPVNYIYEFIKMFLDVFTIFLWFILLFYGIFLIVYAYLFVKNDRLSDITSIKEAIHFFSYLFKSIVEKITPLLNVFNAIIIKPLIVFLLFLDIVSFYGIVLGFEDFYSQSPPIKINITFLDSNASGTILFANGLYNFYIYFNLNKVENIRFSVNLSPHYLFNDPYFDNVICNYTLNSRKSATFICTGYRQSFGINFKVKDKREIIPLFMNNFELVITRLPKDVSAKISLNPYTTNFTYISRNLRCYKETHVGTIFNGYRYSTLHCSTISNSREDIYMLKITDIYPLLLVASKMSSEFIFQSFYTPLLLAVFINIIL